ncbi:transglutaminase domain-containing protein [Apibacter adventoris]|uniref:Transglutaminase-like domain-containing protein n=1 Tax=Apibacter adventoris TaxID=1679466 RepID=A0A2S8A7R5_9FLAO|nr:transglutaminase domain-containing protein [Apibacter adventoris]PQL90615.1 hypothetical protein C4S77_12125 [Apibacter adventoris]
MKRITSFFLFLITINIFSQNKTEEKIWNFLLNNKRKEARELYDKSFLKTKDSNFNYLFLDAIISIEEGQMFFDDKFVKSFVKISPDASYIYPLINQPFMFVNTDLGEDTYTCKKMDVLASSKKYEAEDVIIQYKLYCDKKRGDIESYNNFTKALNNVDKWQFCGVFENLNGSGIDIQYEPEIYAKNDRLFNANANGKVGWYNQKYYQNIGFHSYDNEKEYAPGIIYAQSFIESPIEQTVFLQLGTNNEFKAFLNDCEIYSTHNKGYKETGSVLLKLKLPKGVSRLLIKSELTDSSAFLAKFTDENKQTLTNLKYCDNYKEYNLSKIEDLKLEEAEFHYETFFKQKIKEETNNITNKIILLNGYLANKQNTKADEILDEFEKAYPKSSFIRNLRIKYNVNINEDEKNKEIVKNIQVDDPEYYVSLFDRMADQNWSSSVSIHELEELKNRLAKTKSEIGALTMDVLISGRKQDMVKTINKVKEILDASYQNSSFLVLFADIFDYSGSSQDNSIIRLENALKEKDDFAIISDLLKRYDKAKKYEEYEKLLLSLIEKYPDVNFYRKEYIQIYNKELKYNESLKQAKEALENFPYSSSILADIGYIYTNLNNKEESVKYLKSALLHNSANTYLRNVLKDINKEQDEIDNIAVKDLYSLIKERRNTKLIGESGATKLLDEYIVNIFPEGGSKGKETIIYEITSEQGVEDFKEYNVNYYSNILKSEIIKKNGVIVPAEKNAGNIVFTNLEVGDVILIQYDEIEKKSGRFFKDFNEVFYFNGTYPVVESRFTIIAPENMNYFTFINNGKIESKTKNIKNKKYTTWVLKNTPSFDYNEYYAKPYLDICTSVVVGTIKSWGEIANWYADVVSKVMVEDKKLELAFNEIFPQGVTSLSQNEISEKIYNYIQKNIKYSYMDFRQSGYIPQKPSRTLQTKLGDCKDFSALFVTLAQKAGLQANLVLVLTNDNEQSSLSLPNLGFNHCIAKVKIDGKDVFLELTNKYLPFRAISLSNYKAKALVINHNKTENDNAKLIELNNANNLENKVNIFTEVFIDTDSKKIKMQYNSFGTSKSFYNQLFSEANSEKERKNKLEEQIGHMLNKSVMIKSSKLIKGNDLTSLPLIFETEIEIAEKSKKIGNMNLLSVPFFSQVYNKNIILNEQRETDIYYISYEGENDYKEEIVLNLTDGKKFIEVPENKKFQYGKRKFELTYDQISPTKLRIIKTAQTSWENIPVNEYKNFKEFVENIIEAESEVIGYK